ncbi:C-type lectin domain family 4 member C-like [Pseudochaenichthys georgianus]|uniref:C-type lectin domain family 4 member C-like n=1 Tax=Pseudochaenichthys georgianus TaxID=52239 RepID=UPI00146BAA0F|nr:C-type lectin domain family 4 member C-like [Pseudochaenichthys georgianus]
MMEEELNYVTVTFKTKGNSAHEKSNDMEAIYDEVNTLEKNVLDADPATPEKENEAQRYTPLHLVAAALGILCFILVSAFIAVRIHFNTVMSEQHREGNNLMAENLQLGTEITDLKRQREELTRERDQLNWTLGVIMEYQDLPVKTLCPQKVCKPCLDGWVPFQSNCYLFKADTYYSNWKTWQDSRSDCQRMRADLVVIESLEEQEFINNHTEDYHNDDNHGYWIGLSKTGKWTWLDGRNLTVTFWKPQDGCNRGNCVLSQQRADPPANWCGKSCSIKNRWICETRALIKQD